MRPSRNYKRTLLKAFWPAMILWLIATQVSAQSLDSLNRLTGYKTEIYYSTGAKQQAEEMGKRCDKVMSFYKSLLDFEPTLILLVLSPGDWSKYTNFPFYGMPHFDDVKKLVVASEDNPFWKSFIPNLDQLPKDLAKQVKTAYTAPEGTLSMRNFFDLLAIHEVGHAFHNQGGLTIQRKWMGELFANILLHTYIAEKEPKLLPALTIFPKMVVSTTKKSDLKFTSLTQLEDNYDELGQNHPNNYGWYQCRWHMAAGNIYDRGGKKAIKQLWSTLKEQKIILSDKEFSDLLATKAHQSIADVMLKWDN